MQSPVSRRFYPFLYTAYSRLQCQTWMCWQTLDRYHLLLLGTMSFSTMKSMGWSRTRMLRYVHFGQRCKPHAQFYFRDDREHQRLCRCPLKKRTQYRKLWSKRQNKSLLVRNLWPSLRIRSQNHLQLLFGHWEARSQQPNRLKASLHTNVTLQVYSKLSPNQGQSNRRRITMQM